MVSGMAHRDNVLVQAAVGACRLAPGCELFARPRVLIWQPAESATFYAARSRCFHSGGYPAGGGEVSQVGQVAPSHAKQYWAVWPVDNL